GAHARACSLVANRPDFILLPGLRESCDYNASRSMNYNTTATCKPLLYAGKFRASRTKLGWWNGGHVRLRGVCRKACGFKSRPEQDFNFDGRSASSLQLDFSGFFSSASLRCNMDALYLVGIAVLALFAFVLAVVLFNFFGLWLRARIANAPVSLGKMVGMRLRKVPVGLIVDNRITAVKAGLDVRSDPLEAHYLAGGDVSHVVLALIAADKAGISL